MFFLIDLFSTFFRSFFLVSIQNTSADSPLPNVTNVTGTTDAIKTGENETKAPQSTSNNSTNSNYPSNSTIET